MYDYIIKNIKDVSELPSSIANGGIIMNSTGTDLPLATTGGVGSIIEGEWTHEFDDAISESELSSLFKNSIMGVYKVTDERILQNIQSKVALLTVFGSNLQGLKDVAREFIDQYFTDEVAEDMLSCVSEYLNLSNIVMNPNSMENRFVNVYNDFFSNSGFTTSNMMASCSISNGIDSLDIVNKYLDNQAVIMVMMSSILYSRIILLLDTNTMSMYFLYFVIPINDFHNAEVHIDGNYYELDPEFTYEYYGQQYGFSTLYTQNSCSWDDNPANYEIDITIEYPSTGDYYWTYCNKEPNPNE